MSFVFVYKLIKFDNKTVICYKTIKSSKALLMMIIPINNSPAKKQVTWANRLAPLLSTFDLRKYMEDHLPFPTINNGTSRTHKTLGTPYPWSFRFPFVRHSLQHNTTHG